MPSHRMRVGVLDVESGNLHGTWFAERLQARWRDLDVAIRAVGPVPRRKARSHKGGHIELRGFYSEQTYRALVAREVDVGVHRTKDLPIPLPDDVRLVAITERKTPLDVLVTADGAILDELEPGARVGVSSLRREAQLSRYRPDLALEFIVGSLSERIHMIESGKLRGVVVAAAGIEWRGWQERVAEVFTAQVCLPAVGQGSLGILVRADDTEMAEKLRFLNHTLSRQEIEAERSFAQALNTWEGAPIGALARVRGDILRIEGCVCGLSGDPILREWAEGFPEDPLRTGERLARKLLENGASDILQRARAQVELE